MLFFFLEIFTFDTPCMICAECFVLMAFCFLLSTSTVVSLDFLIFYSMVCISKFVEHDCTSLPLSAHIKCWFLCL